MKALLDLLLKAAGAVILKQFISLIQNKQSNGGCDQSSQLYELLNTAYKDNIISSKYVYRSLYLRNGQG